jgi:hypothetical protein
VTVPDESLSVDELAAMATDAERDCFSKAGWKIVGRGRWCPTCMLPSAIVRRRVVFVMNGDGGSRIECGDYLYCVDEEAWKAVIR